jgi:ATP-binding protein involved in chromosome partitioning
VREGGDTGRPIVVEAPESPAALAFAQVAGKVAAQISIQAMRVLRVIQTA